MNQSRNAPNEKVVNDVLIVIASQIIPGIMIVCEVDVCWEGIIISF
jgi:hypothetical protein